MDEIITKAKFLAEHNRLSPKNLQATLAVLNRFKKETGLVVKDTRWSFKHRMDFIAWLSESAKKTEKVTKKSLFKQEFRNYPETH